MKGNSIKTILKKQLISICVVIMLSCTLFANYAHADVGGLLLSPIIDFTAFLGDTVLYLIQDAVLGMSAEVSLDTVEDDFLMHKWGDDAMKPFMKDNFDGSSDLKDYKTGPGDDDYIKDSDMDHGFFGFLSYKYPTIYLSPAEIFAGRVEMFDIDFISSKDDKDSRIPAEALHKTISEWYATLRNFALAGMLCVLIYVGIRIIISSTAKDTSKYKSMLTDWLVAMCLLFFIHYLILLLVTLTKEITVIFGDAANSSNYVLVKVTGGEAAEGFVANQMGLARFLVQYNKLSVRTAYLIIYIALVGFTFYYSFVYIKRTLMMALLTLSAPIICLMYPIDKIGDGSAQSFKSWFNEVLYTCLLQPFHLILYTIFVGGATQLAMNNPLYSIAVLFFMIPAEKFFKDMLGFTRKAKNVGTSPAVAGAVGGFMAGQAKKLLTGGGGKKKEGGKGGSDDGDGSGNEKVRENKNKTASDKNGSKDKTKRAKSPLGQLLDMDDEEAYDLYKGGKNKQRGDKNSHKEYRKFRRELAWDGVKDSVGGAVNKGLDGVGKVAKFLSEDDEGKAYREKTMFMAKRKASRAIRNTAGKVIKGTPKTVLKAGGRIYGAYAGAVLGAGYAALKGDPDPTQEMFGGGVGGMLIGGKLASNLTPSAVASAQGNSKIDLSGTDFKKLGKQIGDGVSDALANTSLNPKIDLNGLEVAINSTLGTGYSVDKMGLQSIVNQLNDTGSLDGSSRDVDKIVDAILDTRNPDDALKVQTSTGDVALGAKINTDTLKQQLKDSLGTFEIERIGVNAGDIEQQLNNQIQNVNGKAYLAVDGKSLEKQLEIVGEKTKIIPGKTNMEEAHKAFVEGMENVETKLIKPNS